MWCWSNIYHKLEQNSGLLNKVELLSAQNFQYTFNSKQGIRRLFTR